MNFHLYIKIIIFEFKFGIIIFKIIEHGFPIIFYLIFFFVLILHYKFIIWMINIINSKDL